MRTQVISRDADLLVRRLVLEPGEAMPWQTDACRRFSVVVRGDCLRIDLRDSGEPATVAIHPGMADWHEPEARVHRAVNAGTTTYEEVVLFFLDPPGIDPQPQAG